MADQPVQTVDDDDNVIGSGSVDEVRSKGLRHRIARVIVRDQQGRVLLQKRAYSLQTYPGRWDTSAAGHVDAGEDYETAAAREMFEEIGLRSNDLQEVAYYKSESKYDDLDIRRFNKTFAVKVRSSQEFHPDPDEVHELRWFTKTQLKKMLADPAKVTDGLEHYIRHHL